MCINGLSETGPPDIVDIIIPSYNSSRYIKDTLNSVFAQTYPHYRVIVVNDGSPDTPALEMVLRPYMDRVIYITQENRGLAGARNTGLKAATGTFVALLDSDDIWLPDYLADQVRFLKHHPDFDLVYCNARFFGDSPYSRKEYMAEFPSEGEATSAAIISRRCHVFVSILSRREALLSVGFDESLRSCEDFDCWIRFTAAEHKIGYHRKILVLYRKHKASLSADPRSMAICNIQVLTKSCALWEDDSEEAALLRRARTAKIAELEAIEGKLALLCHDFTSARSHLETANAYYKSARIAAAIALIKLVPRLVVMTYRLRGALFAAYRDL